MPDSRGSVEQQTYSTTCRCECVRIDFRLPKPIGGYEPRRCDCAFCTARQIAYLSDKDGVLIVKSRQPMRPVRQGSEQAVFWACPVCNEIVAVTHQDGGTLRGAANAALFANHHTMKAPITVSPKLLSPEEKRDRWVEIWASVEFATGSAE